jgi:hydrogenase maturation protease
MGLSLLPQIEDAAAFIAIDAAAFGGEPGAVRVFEGAAMDEQLGGRKRSVHEVALADLMAAALLDGRLPARRALVAVEPASSAVGLAPTPRVAAAIPQLCRAVEGLVRQWTR